MIELCFDCFRPIFRLFSTMFNFLDRNRIYFDCPRCMLQLSSTSFSTVFDQYFASMNRNWVCLTVLHMFRLWPTYVATAFEPPLFCLSLPLVMIRVFWIHGSTVLDLCFDCAWPLSRLLDWSCVCFDYARLLPLMFQLCSICFSTMLDIHFDCARPMSWICSTYISTVLDVRLLELLFGWIRPIFFLQNLTYVSTFMTKIWSVPTISDYERPSFQFLLICFKLLDKY